MNEREDERLKKLMDRSIEPLPNYSSDGANRVLRLSFEGSSSEFRDQVPNEMLSERKIKKIIEIDKKPVQNNIKKEEVSHQLTLDAFNFCMVPQINKKQVKRVLSDCEKQGQDSNSVSNASSQDARGMLFVNGLNQKGKIDGFVNQQNTITADSPVPDKYFEYMIKEKQDYIDKFTKMQSEIKRLEEVVAGKDKEIKRLREILDRSEREIYKFKKSKDKLCRIILELEGYKRAERKDKIKQMKNRLGELVISVVDTSVNNSGRAHVWVDGPEILKVKEELRNLDREKQSIEVAKKTIRLSAKKVSKKPIDSDGFDEFLDSDEDKYQRIINGDPKESTKQLDNVLSTILRREAVLREKLEEYELEKVVLNQEEKLLSDEIK